MLLIKWNRCFKMKRYKVTILKKDFGLLEIQAEDKQQASDIAINEEMKETVDWINSEVEICEIEEVTL